jgi:hypothetical protein
MAIEFEGGRAVIVADGVGSLPRSGDAAQIAVEAARWLWGSNGSISEDELFDRVNAAVLAVVGGEGATTMISIAQRKDVVTVAWVGNGAGLQLANPTWAVKGESWSDPLEADSISLQWTNLVIPHVVYEDGRDRLALTLGSSKRVQPDLVAVRVSAAPVLFLAVTDGIHSGEHTELGLDEVGDRWQLVSRPLQAVLAEGKRALESAQHEDFSDDRLTQRLDNVLGELLSAQLLSDDATVAGMLLKPSSEYCDRGSAWSD